MSTRKGFLLTAPLFALTPALGDAAIATPSASAAPKPARDDFDSFPYTFDRARFEQILSKPANHKQCFAATKIEDGGVLYGMDNSISAYEDFWDDGPGAMHAVAVLYHGYSITLAMNDAVWNELLTPVIRDKEWQSKASPETRQDVAQLTLGKGNPFLRSETKGPDDVSVQRLVSRGSSFFVCRNALIGLSYGLAHVLKTTAKQVYPQLMAGIVPGALVVPAGVMAINACQEAKFTYIA